MLNKLFFAVLLSILFALPLKADTEKFLCALQYASETSALGGVKSLSPKEFGAAIFELKISKQGMAFSAGTAFGDNTLVVDSYDKRDIGSYLLVKASDETTMLTFMKRRGLSFLNATRINEFAVSSFAAKCENF